MTESVEPVPCQERGASPHPFSGMSGVPIPPESAAFGRLGGGELPADLAQLGLDLVEHVDDVGVELASCLRDDLYPRRLPAERMPVRTVARHRVERVGDGE